MNLLRRAAMWLVWHGPRTLSPLGPWLFGFAIDRKGVLVEKGNGHEQDDQRDQQR